MKKPLIIIGVILVILGTCFFLTRSKTRHTVSDFAPYPCDFRAADEIEIEAPGRHMVLTRKNAPWHLSAPYEEALDDGARAELETFMRGKMFVDEKHALDDITRRDFSHEIPTKVSFKHNGTSLCSFELGKSLQLPTADAERRYLIDEKNHVVYRAFVPLMDFGLLLEQPTAGWRMKKYYDAGGEAIGSLSFLSGTESYELDRLGEKTIQRTSGWRLSKAERNGENVDLSRFELDDTRVDTVINLLSPLYVDDWAYDLTAEERAAIQYNGAVVFRVGDETHTLHIGTEADLSKHPQWLVFGDGSRYVKFDDSETIALMSFQRLMGIFPSLDDMRSKKVWSLEASQFAAIEIEQNGVCTRYRPIAPDTWGAAVCDSADAPSEIPNRVLALFTKALLSLQAVRYVPSFELDSAESMLSVPDAVIRVYSGDTAELSATLSLSAPLKSLFRYARVSYPNDTENMPIFVISEGSAAILLRVQAK